jgi:hypothetical protein
MNGKVPPSSRSKYRAPLSRNSEIAKAARLYEKFSGHEAEIDGSVNVPAIPKVAVLIGSLDFVGYTTIRDGRTEKYIHKFAASDKPALCVAPDGSRILVVGGRYKFTERGIVDKSDKTR